MKPHTSSPATWNAGPEEAGRVRGPGPGAPGRAGRRAAPGARRRPRPGRRRGPGTARATSRARGDDEPAGRQVQRRAGSANGCDARRGPGRSPPAPRAARCRRGRRRPGRRRRRGTPAGRGGWTWCAERWISSTSPGAPVPVPGRSPNRISTAESRPPLGGGRNRESWSPGHLVGDAHDRVEPAGQVLAGQRRRARSMLTPAPSTPRCVRDQPAQLARPRRAADLAVGDGAVGAYQHRHGRPGPAQAGAWWRRRSR